MPKIYNDACEAVSSIKIVSKDAPLVVYMACVALAAVMAYYSHSTLHIFWNTIVFPVACVLETYFVLVLIWKILCSIVAWFKDEKNDQLALMQYEGPLATINIYNDFALYKRNGDTK